MAVRISIAAAIAACDSIVASIDEGAGANGTLVIYEGARPATVDTAIGAQVALVTFALANPSFAAAQDVSNSGHATANTIDPVQADANGTAQFFRVFDADGNAVFDGSVTDTGGNGDLKLSSTAIIENIDVTVVSLTASMPTA
ncbi:hypothetical protein [Neoaquamicrobium sediminum]|uniref:hypothetical protein n=1 Tax=Neoaquamicrobium sediminum TaxID=1849104 RepID=UPI001564870E|nr:hypothetical protein [Mesorhizobium sediminum]NRC54139.1 hypothetical protein [Mesorhizobium sediminum]